MTLTATRDNDEGFFSGLFGPSKKVAVDPVELVNTALKGFQDAADNLVAAQDILDKQKQEHEDEIAALRVKADACEAQSSRLTRIRDRLSDFLA